MAFGRRTKARRAPARKVRSGGARRYTGGRGTTRRRSSGRAAGSPRTIRIEIVGAQADAVARPPLSTMTAPDGPKKARF